jgi:predicted ATPase with chaperone activity
MSVAPAGPATRMLSAQEPTSVEQTGLELIVIADMALKIVYFQGMITGQALSEHLCLPYFNVLERALSYLKREEYVEVSGSSGFGELAYQYTLTPKGQLRAQEQIDRTAYAGPAPVTLEAYQAMIMEQAHGPERVSRDEVINAMSDMVVPDGTIDQVGQAVNTGRSMFLFGEPGNGKTAIAERMAELLGGYVLIPHAITVDGQIIKVLDVQNHKPIPVPPGRVEYDRRWVLCKRPAVMVGGELTLSSLDLVYDPISKVYEAPLQMKANNGMFLIDDFGRQQVRPSDLLNRWIVPLEKRVDFLTLKTGKKIEIPFEEVIVFSTNLKPRELVDDAFLRRIQSKIHVINPTANQYREIFRRQCEHFNIPFDQQGLVHLLKEHYVKQQRELRACHPRDILRIMVGIAKYLDVPPQLDPDLLDRACKSYFVDLG